MLTKEDYLEYLDEEAELYGEGYRAIRKLVIEHFELKENHESLLDKIEEMDATIHSLDCELCEFINPKPYTFEDLKEGMVVWDCEFNMLIQIFILRGNEFSYEMFGSENVDEISFKPNRFYPLTKIMFQEEK